REFLDGAPRHLGGVLNALVPTDDGVHRTSSHGDRSSRLSSPLRAKSSAGKSPEAVGEPEARKDGGVLLARVRNPAGREAVIPPRLRELLELAHRDGRTGLPAAEPAGDVLFRPEEVHPASVEADAVPPL